MTLYSPENLSFLKTIFRKEIYSRYSPRQYSPQNERKNPTSPRVNSNLLQIRKLASEYATLYDEYNYGNYKVEDQLVLKGQALDDKVRDELRTSGFPPFSLQYNDEGRYFYLSNLPESKVALEGQNGKKYNVWYLFGNSIGGTQISYPIKKGFIFYKTDTTTDTFYPSKMNDKWKNINSLLRSLRI